jgi:nitrate reductase assembly molybdenum cofactor insertion protein NarJ
MQVRYFQLFDFQGSGLITAHFFYRENTARRGQLLFTTSSLFELVPPV